MAYTQSQGYNNTASYTDWDYNFVYQNGVGFPSGRADRDGNNTVQVISIGGGYSSVSATWKFVYGGTEYTSGIFSSSGGTMQVRQWNNTSSRMYFGRNTGAAGTVYDNGDGEPFSAGALSYSMSWRQVPSAPASASASRSGRSVTVTGGSSSDDGGGTIGSYKVQYRTAPDNATWSAWGSEQTLSSGSYTYSSLTPALYYQFRVYAVNEAGNSPATSSASVFVSGGGKRWDGSAWQATTTAKRYNGTAWIDLTTAKRWDGSNWVDLS